MKYFLVTFLVGILCQNTLARGLDNPVLNDFKRRLVRLEERQFSEGENLEHRMLLLETHPGNQREGKTMEPNPFNISKVEKPAEGMTFLQRLEEVERNWVQKLEVHLGELSSKHENLSLRLSVIEKQVREAQEKAFLSEKAEKKSEGLEQQELILVKPKTNPETETEYSETETEFGSGNGESEEDIEHIKSTQFRQFGERFYYIEENETKKKTWKSAVAYCKKLNAHLVSFQNMEDWIFLVLVLPSHQSYWLDLNDRSTQGKFVSEFTGKTAPFYKWADGEPSFGPGEDCVELYGWNYRLNDAHCLNENFYVCELN